MELAYRIQCHIITGIVGSPYFDNYLYSQKLPFLNTSFYHNAFLIHSWDWMLPEINCHLFMISHKLQVFKMDGRWELAGH